MPKEVLLIFQSLSGNANPANPARVFIARDISLK
jgi:hypothetical protein